jgi:hypothetical protein
MIFNLFNSKTFITLLTSCIICFVTICITVDYAECNYDFEGYPHANYLLEDLIYEEDGGTILNIDDTNYGGKYKVWFQRYDSSVDYTVVDEDVYKTTDYNYGVKFLVRSPLYSYLCLFAVLSAITAYACFMRIIIKIKNK